MTTLLAFLAALMAQPAGSARTAQAEARAGDVYEILRVSDMTQSDSHGGSGDSHDSDRLVERVIMVRGDGVELEFDLPERTSAEDRARQWQFPVRVLRPPHGPLRLLNGPKLTARVDRWLASAGWRRERCGRWMFTWTEIRIECDPQSVLEGLTAMDLAAAELRDGAPYQDSLGREPTVLRREAGGADGAALVAEVEVDLEVLRRQQAEAEAALLDIMGDRPELRAYREAQAPRRVSGTIRIRFESDAAGRTLRRTRVIRLETERMNGERENRTITETVERRLVSPPPS